MSSAIQNVITVFTETKIPEPDEIVSRHHTPYVFYVIFST